MDNFQRMIRLADEFFETKNDPSQITITEEVMEQHRSIHPATMGEIADEQGPLAWTIVIPTTRAIRNQFMKGQIGEAELLKLTLANIQSAADNKRFSSDLSSSHTAGPAQNEPNRIVNEYSQFTSVYLCSALVLPEFRGKGLAKKIVCDSIRAIQKDLPVEELFVWAFSMEGKELARNIALSTKLTLFEYSD